MHAVNFHYVCDSNNACVVCRYADIMVHRLLATAIAADTTHPEMIDSRRVQVSGGYACILFGVKIAVIKCRNVCRNISFNTKVTVEISDTECFAISGCEQLTVNSF